jgi:hypothetical protein
MMFDSKNAAHSSLPRLRGRDGEGEHALIASAICPLTPSRRDGDLPRKRGR